MAETEDRLAVAKNQATLVEQAIRAEAYYALTWDFINKDEPKIEDCTTVEDVLRRFQIFWEALPDHRDIHRPPFYRICELAEEYISLPNIEEAQDAYARTVQQTMQNAQARGSKVILYVEGDRKLSAEEREEQAFKKDPGEEG